MVQKIGQFGWKVGQMAENLMQYHEIVVKLDQFRSSHVWFLLHENSDAIYREFEAIFHESGEIT